MSDRPEIRRHDVGAGEGAAGKRSHSSSYGPVASLACIRSRASRIVSQVRKIHFTAVFRYAEAAETELRRKLGITDDWPDYSRRARRHDVDHVRLGDPPRRRAPRRGPAYGRSRRGQAAPLPDAVRRALAPPENR
jgi:hypothetical protein